MEVEVLFSDALEKHRAGQLREAECQYRKIILKEPRHSDSLHLLGVIALQLGERDKAVVLIKKAIAINGQVAAYHSNLGIALFELGRIAESINEYKKALEINPDYLDAYLNLGNALMQQRSYDQAEIAYLSAIRLNPRRAGGYKCLGNAYQEKGSRIEAVNAYQTAIKYDTEDYEAYFKLGNALVEIGWEKEAIDSYKSAININSKYAPVYTNLGVVLLKQGFVQEAIEAHNNAIKLDDKLSVAYSNLGAALREAGLLNDAIAAYKTSIYHEPGNCEAQLNLGNALVEIGESEKARGSYEAAIKNNSENAGAYLAKAMAELLIYIESSEEGKKSLYEYSNALERLVAWSGGHLAELGQVVGNATPFFLAYRLGNHLSLLMIYGELISKAMSEKWPEVSKQKKIIKKKNDKIRMLVVCGYIRSHSVWNVILKGVVKNIDRNKFEIFIYHTRHFRDIETSWAEGVVDKFIQGPLSTDRWLEKIKHDRPDIIFYPEIGMDAMTTRIAALRLAPLQITSWGHPITTGLPTIDLFLSGELLEPPEAEKHYCEKLIRLPGAGICAEWIKDSLQYGKLVNKQLPISLANTNFVICQSPFKLDPAFDNLIVKILLEVENSQIWVVESEKCLWATKRFIARLGSELERVGIDPRMKLKQTSWMPQPEFLEFIEQMDIYLDWPSFSGYTTAWQAVHCGLPVLTIEGEYLRQRLAAGLLRQIGEIETIAYSEDEYVSIAKWLATECRDVELRTKRRGKIKISANLADDQMSVVRALEGCLIEELQARQFKDS